MASLDLPQTMKAWRFRSTAGGIEKNLKFDVNTPLPKAASSLGKNQVLVRVSSAALNPADYKFPESPFVSMLLIAKPASPGLDFAGTVVASGANCTELQPGQQVFGTLDLPQQQCGTLGEYVVASRKGIAPLPEGVLADNASGLGVAGLTAYQSIVPHVKKGDNVFINGGSGGTGTFAIQIAKAKECFVATTCSAGNVQLCKDLRADLVIDYKTSDVVVELAKSGRRYDLVVDNIGTPAAIYWEGRKYAKPGAEFLQIGIIPSDLFSPLSRFLWPNFLCGPGLRYHLLLVKQDPAQLQQLAEWVKEGTVKVVKDSIFSHEDVPKAFERLKTGRARGKIVVRGVTQTSNT